MDVKRVMHMYPGTYVNSKSKSCAKMIEHLSPSGWNPNTPQCKEEALSGPARGSNPTTPQWKKDPHSGGHTQQQHGY